MSAARASFPGGGESRLPAAILMSGTGSNARRLLEYRAPEGGSPAYRVRVIVSDNPASSYREIAERFGVAFRLNDIYAFCGVPRDSAPLRPEESARLRDRRRRAAFDRRTAGILAEHGVRLVAAAGYDWIISPQLCRQVVIVNVHPGDLRVRDAAGGRRYVGLGWVPTAKALLDGAREVRTTTHLVTSQLDGGPIARVSRAVAAEPPGGLQPGQLRPPGVTLGDVVRDLRASGGRRFGKLPLVERSRQIQERLKVEGDWVEFPYTVHRVAELMLAGRLQLSREGQITLDGGTPPEEFVE